MTTTVLIECPLCDWKHEPEANKILTDSNLAAAPAVANALGMPADALMSMHLHQARQRDEHTLDQHMRTHTPQEWLPELMRLREALDAIGKERNDWARQLADVRDERDTARAQADRMVQQVGDRENTVLRIEALLYEWEQLGRGDGAHGRQLRRALDGPEAEATS